MVSKTDGEIAVIEYVTCAASALVVEHTVVYSTPLGQNGPLAYCVAYLRIVGLGQHFGFFIDLDHLDRFRQAYDLVYNNLGSTSTTQNYVRNASYFNVKIPKEFEGKNWRAVLIPAQQNVSSYPLFEKVEDQITPPNVVHPLRKIHCNPNWSPDFKIPEGYSLAYVSFKKGSDQTCFMPVRELETLKTSYPYYDRTKQTSVAEQDWKSVIEFPAASAGKENEFSVVVPADLESGKCVLYATLVRSPRNFDLFNGQFLHLSVDPHEKPRLAAATVSTTSTNLPPQNNEPNRDLALAAEIVEIRSQIEEGAWKVVCQEMHKAAALYEAKACFDPKKHFVQPGPLVAYIISRLLKIGITASWETSDRFVIDLPASRK